MMRTLSEEVRVNPRLEQRHATRDWEWSGGEFQAGAKAFDP